MSVKAFNIVEGSNLRAKDSMPRLTSQSHLCLERILKKSTCETSRTNSHYSHFGYNACLCTGNQRTKMVLLLRVAQEATIQEADSRIENEGSCYGTSQSLTCLSVSLGTVERRSTAQVQCNAVYLNHIFMSLTCSAVSPGVGILGSGPGTLPLAF